MQNTFFFFLFLGNPLKSFPNPQWPLPNHTHLDVLFAMQYRQNQKIFLRADREVWDGRGLKTPEIYIPVKLHVS